MTPGNQTMNELDLRVCTTDDLPSIFALSNTIFQVPVNESKYSSLQEWESAFAKDSCILAIYQNNQPISFLFAFHKTLELDRNPEMFLHIWLCGTLPSYRSKGFMSQLFVFLRKIAEGRNCPLSVATIPEKYPQMPKFLRSQGFELVKEILINLGDSKSAKQYYVNRNSIVQQ